MSTSDKILTILDENRGEYISGERLADMLDVSRTAIWKAMKKLVDEGYNIESVTNKGYMMSENTDVLSETSIRKYLHEETNVILDVRKTVESTNIVMKDYVDMPEGYVIAAAEQTGGIGRLGRPFKSPKNTGIYFSILLKPAIDYKDVTLLTVIAAVSICEAIEKYSDKKPQVKWVNDVFIGDKKVSGTLTQASMSMENLHPEYVIVGTGINIYEPEGGFGKDLKNIAGAVFDEKQNDIKNKILAEVLNNYFYYYRNFEKKEFIKKYQERSLVDGKNIYVVEGENKIPATAIAIDDECHLIVRYEDGSEAALSTGEISIRLR